MPICDRRNRRSGIAPRRGVCKQWTGCDHRATFCSGNSRATLKYDFELEKNFDYVELSVEAMICHFAKFISGIRQIHFFVQRVTRGRLPFMPSNISAIWVFLCIMRHLPNMHGIFAMHWFGQIIATTGRGIKPDAGYLERFFRNVLPGEHNSLKIGIC